MNNVNQTTGNIGSLYILIRMIRYTYFLAVMVFSLCFNSYGQTRLEYTSELNNKQLSFTIGEQIGFRKDGGLLKNGQLQQINDSSLIINGESIRIKDISHIGHRKRGTGFITFSGAFLSGSVLGYFALSSSNAAGVRIAGLTGSVFIFTLTEITAIKNRMYKVKDKYRFVVY